MLSKLTKIYLRENVCILEDFTSETQIATLKQKLNEKCAYDETEDRKTKIKALEVSLDYATSFNSERDKTIKTLKSNLKICETSNTKLKKEVEGCGLENAKLKNVATELERNLRECRSVSLIDPCKQRRYDVEKCLEESNLHLSIKLEEISKLLLTVQEKNAEIIEMKEKNLTLEKRIKLLTEF